MGITNLQGKSVPQSVGGDDTDLRKRTVRSGSGNYPGTPQKPTGSHATDDGVGNIGVASMDTDSFKVKITLPDYVQKVARMLVKEGYEAYLVGGAVRDLVLGTTPDDYDIATKAKPDEMLKIFPKAVSTSAKFGTIFVLMPDKHGETYEVEVTTYRDEEHYTKGRWPTKVEFIDDIVQDLARRDFTINAMALHLSLDMLDGEEIEKEWVVLDPFGGRADLAKKVIKAVGEPLERFKEDGLRSMRACRLASQLEFRIEPETFEAIRRTIPVFAQVSPERVRDEFVKTLMNSPKPSYGIELMRQAGLLEVFMPELLEGVGVEQKLFHAHDVYTHSLATCDRAPDRIKLAALFHDIGKPRKDTHDGHFYGHDLEGMKMTKEIMTRLRFSKSEIERTANLVRHHMFYYPLAKGETRKKGNEKFHAGEWSDAAVRRFLARVGEENIDDLFELRVADATSNPKTAFDPAEIEALEARIAKLREEDMALKITDLDITGHDLMELGIRQGPEIGRILKGLLDKVIEDPLLNTKEKLVEEARKMVAL